MPWFKYKKNGEAALTSPGGVKGETPKEFKLRSTLKTSELYYKLNDTEYQWPYKITCSRDEQHGLYFQCALEGCDSDKGYMKASTFLKCFKLKDE
jgi:hypothetical protein